MAQPFNNGIDTCVWFAVFAIVVIMAALEKFLRSVCLLSIIRALGIPTLSRALMAQRGHSAFFSDPRERDDPPASGDPTQFDNGSLGTPNVFPTVLADSIQVYPKDLLFQDRPPPVPLNGPQSDLWSPTMTSEPETPSSSTAQDVPDNPHHSAPDDFEGEDEDDLDVESFHATYPHGLYYPDNDSYDLAELSGPSNARNNVNSWVERNDDTPRQIQLNGPLYSSGTEAGAHEGECHRLHGSEDLGSDDQ